MENNYYVNFYQKSDDMWVSQKGPMSAEAARDTQARLKKEMGDGWALYVEIGKSFTMRG